MKMKVFSSTGLIVAALLPAITFGQTTGGEVAIAAKGISTVVNRADSQSVQTLDALATGIEVTTDKEARSAAKQAFAKFVGQTKNSPLQFAIVERVQRNFVTEGGSVANVAAADALLAGLRLMKPASVEVRTRLIELSEIALQTRIEALQLVAIENLFFFSLPSDELFDIHQMRSVRILSDLARANNMTPAVRDSAIETLRTLRPINASVAKARIQALFEFLRYQDTSLAPNQIELALAALADVGWSNPNEADQLEILRMVNVVSERIYTHSPNQIVNQRQLGGLLTMLGQVTPINDRVAFAYAREFARALRFGSNDLAYLAYDQLEAVLPRLESLAEAANRLEGFQRDLITEMTRAGFPGRGGSTTKLDDSRYAMQVLEIIDQLRLRERGKIRMHRGLVLGVLTRAKGLTSTDSLVRRSAAKRLVSLAEKISASGTETNTERAVMVTMVYDAAANALKEIASLRGQDTASLDELLEGARTNRDLLSVGRAKLFTQIMRLGGAAHQKAIAEVLASQILSGEIDCNEIIPLVK